ncbi:TcmI family type II polyketide cyclase [Amycolatopsis sp. NPDC059657]|uniref:TcmI family type II polyketide cyclase n=1 Tax=Amycolatopsis sp. NPDC059657 TaxID=3346899 RepID=UPI00366E118C
MFQSLIVARLRSGDHEAVKEIFAESDRSELPGLVGVRQRSLFHFHGLYFHLIQGEREVGSAVTDVREHPLFRDIDTRLAEHIGAYDPETWRGPQDAMAHRFYHWTA